MPALPFTRYIIREKLRSMPRRAHSASELAQYVYGIDGRAERFAIRQAIFRLRHIDGEIIKNIPLGDGSRGYLIVTRLSRTK